ncbi:PH domain-containing protein [Streptomyces flavofungini]|uniref:PH domain-containing protein n=1 Tax=Streptomyces flavofungini TaxID=68200 RepID=UPI0025AF1707|nr:PH domain-containing protein [Streptomyces flavofungini]WJV50593.1 PH domain-containing protein [Streptomyces flavofungini]
METVRIALSRRRRRSLHLGLAVLTLTLGLIALFVLPGAYAHSTSSGRTATTVLAGIWLPTAFYVMNRANGTTTLTPAGMRIRTVVSRRLIPWHTVTRVEAQRRTGRGGVAWYVARAHLVHGRPVVLPGALADGRQDEEFRAAVEAVERYWERARP